MSGGDAPAYGPAPEPKPAGPQPPKPHAARAKRRRKHAASPAGKKAPKFVSLKPAGGKSRFRLWKLKGRMRRRVRRSWKGLSWSSGWMFAPFRAAAAGVRSVFRGTRFWWRRRQTRHLVQGLPALFAAGFGIYLAVAAGTQQPADLRMRYERAASNAFLRERFDEALLWYERLAQLETTPSSETRYRIAVAAEQLGDARRAAAIMKSLAPPGEQGYAPAHLWQAQKLLAGELGPEALDAARGHALRVLQTRPQDVAANWMMFQFSLADRRPDRAEEHLLRAVRGEPALHMNAAIFYAGKRSRDLAFLHARRAREHYAAKSQAEPDNSEARLQWVRALVFMDDFAQAVAVLRDGLAMAPQGPYAQALADVYVAWADWLAIKSPADTAGRLRVLQQSLKWRPAHAPALLRLLDLADAAGPEEAQEAGSSLEAALVRGDAPAMLHFALGCRAWSDEDADQALKHLEQAYRLDSSMPTVANNLAWVLAFRNEDPDLPRALVLAESAVEQQPRNALFRDTRGRILARMGRWHDALVDLEHALPVLGRQSDIHLVLAEVYDALGQPAIAAEHTRMYRGAGRPDRHNRADR